MENVLIILSYIGVIAFAVSGAMLAIRSEVDLFGVVFLSVITSFAGGLMRDIILNRYPYPALLEMRAEFIVCIVTSLAVFFVAFFCRDAYLRHEGLERIFLELYIVSCYPKYHRLCDSILLNHLDTPLSC